VAEGKLVMEGNILQLPDWCLGCDDWHVGLVVDYLVQK
jgi:hypothetical protein